MKLALFSDTHLGYSFRGQRAEESYENCVQAFDLALQGGADAIVLAGDLFDENTPDARVLAEGFRVFGKAYQAPKSGIKISVRERDGSSKPTDFHGVPIISIHGTHEYRSKDHTNILEVYENAGYLVYLHASIALLEKGDEKVAVHGLSGVPEKYALDALKRWNPRPVPGATNLLVLHQSINEFLPADDPMVSTISLENLPRDFDLIVNGHLHWHSITPLGDHCTFLLTGSTIHTQMKNLEAQQRKGIHFYDTRTKKLEFVELPRQRRLFYHKERFNAVLPQQVAEKAEQLIQADLATNGNGMPPMIRLKLVGSLAKGHSQADIPLSELEKKYEGKAIFSLDKDFVSVDFKKKIAELRELQQSRKSLAQMGLDMLEKNLEETDFNKAFDARRVFELLAEDKLDEALALLTAKKEK
ncbi:MAG: DNA repair exonuclease [Candidatus Diapherotrites archaeon]|uniref:DNA repair exonuclease n=1 Tax=Candidatus Iainarchaeum sp. TaxID=3101447 RepID=A0A8T4LCI1_9ARCH|nr:DNA repair exonuclease [Candidatus Diapherotrites archaeon]